MNYKIEELVDYYVFGEGYVPMEDYTRFRPMVKELTSALELLFNEQYEVKNTRYKSKVLTDLRAVIDKVAWDDEQGE